VGRGKSITTLKEGHIWTIQKDWRRRRVLGYVWKHFVVFLQSQKSVFQLWNVVIRKTSDCDEPANCYESESHSDVSLIGADWWRCTA
jgi:hypothetical protein